VSVVFCVNHAVTDIGVFFPAVEAEADAVNPVATQYSQLDIDVFQLQAAKTTPASGGALDFSSGVVRPNIPGTGAGLLEVRNGA
jgi:hypothetical protein